MKTEDNKLLKILPIIILAVFLVFSGVKGIFKKDAPKESENTDIAHNGETSSIEDSEEESSDSTKPEDAPTENAENAGENHKETSDEITFSNIQSPLIYHLHEEIEELLIPSKFDEELVAELQKYGAIPTGAYETPYNIIEIKDTGYLEIDLDSDFPFYLFTLRLEDRTRTTIKVGVNLSTNTYTFTYMGGRQ